MITIKATTDENGTLVPETTPPNTKHGNHCDGVNFYYFESEQEAENFHKTLS